MSDNPSEVIKRQTRGEWLNEYDRASGGGTRSVPDRKTVIDHDTYLFRYLDHRTTTKSSVAMEFESLDGELRATRFFNVSLQSPRGRRYSAGRRGQFIPPKQGKFRQFWMHAVGKEPTPWCRVHRSMRSRLGPLVFIGRFEPANDSKGQSYFRFSEVHAQK